MAVRLTQNNPVITLRFPEALLKRVDEFGVGRCIGRAETIRQLVSAALERPAREHEEAA